MDQPTKKRVDESWKEQVEREKQAPQPTVAPGSPSAARPGPPHADAPRGPESEEPREPHEQGDEIPQARWDLFISGLAMEALVAMGDMAHPVTRKPAIDLRRAKYLVDLLGVLEEKTKGNLSIDEGRLLSDALYQLRMRYLNKTQAG